MTYKTRPGIELLHVCGVHMLVGTRATWDICSHMTQLSKGAAMAWSMLAKGNKPRTVAEVLAVLSRRPVEETEEKLAELIRRLVEAGYLIEEIEEEP